MRLYIYLRKRTRKNFSRLIDTKAMVSNLVYSCFLKKKNKKFFVWNVKTELNECKTMICCERHLTTGTSMRAKCIHEFHIYSSRSVYMRNIIVVVLLFLGVVWISSMYIILSLYVCVCVVQCSLQVSGKSFHLSNLCCMRASYC